MFPNYSGNPPSAADELCVFISYPGSCCWFLYIFLSPTLGRCQTIVLETIVLGHMKCTKFDLNTRISLNFNLLVAFTSIYRSPNCLWNLFPVENINEVENAFSNRYLHQSAPPQKKHPMLWAWPEGNHILMTEVCHLQGFTHCAPILCGAMRPIGLCSGGGS